MASAYFSSYATYALICCCPWEVLDPSRQLLAVFAHIHDYLPIKSG